MKKATPRRVVLEKHLVEIRTALSQWPLSGIDFIEVPEIRTKLIGYMETWDIDRPELSHFIRLRNLLEHPSPVCNI